MMWLDWVLLALLVFSLISGLIRGLIKSIFDLAGLIVGLLLAGHFYAALAPKLTFIPNENFAKIIAFVIIVAAVAIVAGILGSILKKIVAAIGLGWLDRLGGGVFGVASSLIFLSAGLALLVQFPLFNLEPAMRQSWMAGLLLKVYPLVRVLLPSNFGDIGKFIET